MIPKSAIVSYLLAQELDALLSGAELHKIEYHKDSRQFRFLFAATPKVHLQFSFAPPHFLLQEKWPSPAESFPIWQECSGSRVAAVGGHRDNRLIEIILERETENVQDERFRIVFELLGAQATALLLDEDGIILQALRVIDNERGLRPKALYQFPPPLKQLAAPGEAVVVNAGKRQVTLAFDDSEYRVTGDDIAAAARYPLIVAFQNAAEESQRQQTLDQARNTALGRVRRAIARERNLRGKLEFELIACSDAAQFSRWADLLMAHPHAAIRNDRVEVTDFYANAPTTIPLLTGKSVIESANAYYKQARKLQRSGPALQTRIAKIDAQIGRLESALAAITAADTSEGLHAVVARFQLNTLPQTGAKGEESGQKGYREFVTSAGERILVGKNSDGNDELTFRIARTYDYWFHVQNGPGSHVILMRPDKNRAPSKRSVEEAAAIAAFYSEMRHLRHVPIVYTERRYVRKQRKGGPGQVIYSNVKSVFVDPLLPEGSK